LVCLALALKPYGVECVGVCVCIVVVLVPPYKHSKELNQRRQIRCQSQALPAVGYIYPTVSLFEDKRCVCFPQVQVEYV